MGQFNLKKYLVENKLTTNSRLVKEDSLKAEKPKVITKKEWDRAHKDFKCIINDKTYMMYFDKETQSTVYGPVTVKGLEVNESIVSESLSLAKSQRIIDGDAVGWIKKKNGKIEFVREFKTLRNGLMWQAKTGKKLLQRGDAQIVGVASKERWEKRKAKFPHQYSE